MALVFTPAADAEVRRHRQYGTTPLGDLGPSPALACMIDLHLNCRGTRSLGGRPQPCTCECHDPAADYR